MDWFMQEVSQLETKLLKQWGSIELWRSEAPYGVAFVVCSPEGDEIIYDGEQMLTRVRQLRQPPVLANHGLHPTCCVGPQRKAARRTHRRVKPTVICTTNEQ